MNTDYIRESLMLASNIALNGVQAGREIARAESQPRIARLESEVLKLRQILRDNGIEPPEGVEVGS